MVCLTFMQKSGSVGILWALLASMDLMLRGKYVNCETYKTCQNKEAHAFYLVPRILLYIHTVLPILPNQSPQKELLFEDELIACFSTQNGRKKTRCECRFKRLAQHAKENKQRWKCIKHLSVANGRWQGGKDLRALGIFSDILYQVKEQNCLLSLKTFYYACSGLTQDIELLCWDSPCISVRRRVVWGRGW